MDSYMPMFIALSVFSLIAFVGLLIYHTLRGGQQSKMLSEVSKAKFGLVVENDELKRELSKYQEAARKATLIRSKERIDLLRFMVEQDFRFHIAMYCAVNLGPGAHYGPDMLIKGILFYGFTISEVDARRFCEAMNSLGILKFRSMTAMDEKEYAMVYGDIVPLDGWMKKEPVGKKE